jgi:voltage-gated potassium channel
MHRLRKLYLALCLFAASVLIGMTGFIWIENLGWVNAFYMAIITIGSVGFTEVHELSQTGRLFTAFYIIFNLGLYAYAIAVIGQYFIEGELKNIFTKINIEKKLRKMKDHIIVCGFGRNGKAAVEELLSKNITVVAIEKNSFNINNRPSLENKNFLCYEGDATQDEILIMAGIHKASFVITTLPDDADNVFITLTAKELNPKITVVSRASSQLSEKKLKRAGADYVVIPELIGGYHMANLISKSQVDSTEWLIQKHTKSELEMEEISIKCFLNNFHSKSLSDLKMKLTKDQIIVGYRDYTGELIFNPNEDIRVSEGDSVILVNTRRIDYKIIK